MAISDIQKNYITNNRFRLRDIYYALMISGLWPGPVRVRDVII